MGAFYFSLNLAPNKKPVTKPEGWYRESGWKNVSELEGTGHI